MAEGRWGNATRRMDVSASLKTHGIWQNSIGYDPYAPEEGEAEPDKKAAKRAKASASLQDQSKELINISKMAPGACRCESMMLQPRKRSLTLVGDASPLVAGGGEDRGLWKGRGKIKGLWEPGRGPGMEEEPPEVEPPGQEQQAGLGKAEEAKAGEGERKKRRREKKRRRKDAERGKRKSRKREKKRGRSESESGGESSEAERSDGASSASSPPRRKKRRRSSKKRD